MFVSSFWLVRSVRLSLSTSVLMKHTVVKSERTKVVLSFISILATSIQLYKYGNKKNNNNPSLTLAVPLVLFRGFVYKRNERATSQSRRKIIYSYHVDTSSRSSSSNRNIRNSRNRSRNRNSNRKLLMKN